MKLNITRPDGTVNFTIDTKYIKTTLLFLFILPISFFTVWSFEIAPLFYDIALSMLIAWKLTPKIIKKLTRKQL